MKKELLIILVLLGLPTLFIMTFEAEVGASGYVINELANLRLERLNLYNEFPVTENPVANSIKEGLRAGSAGSFYSIALSSGIDFFHNERIIVGNLLKLSCLSPLGNKGRFVSKQGMDVVMIKNKFFDMPSSYFVGYCTPLSETAEFTLKKLIKIDYELVLYTIEHSKCPETKNIEIAKYFFEQGNFEQGLIFLENSWISVSNC